MGQIKWYKRDPEAALEGMRKLTLEQRGAYNTVLDLIYLRDGNLPDDDRFIAGYLGVDVRVWMRLKGGLIGLGKLFVENGQLRNNKADEVVATALAKVTHTRHAGKVSAESKARKSAATRNENNTLGSTDVETGAATSVLSRETEIKNKLETNVSSNTGASETEARLESKSFWKTVPDGVPLEPWRAFLRMRRDKHKPVTNDTAKMLFEELAKLRGQGHDSAAVLRQSVLNSWTGLFPIDPPKDTRNGTGSHRPKDGAVAAFERQALDARAERAAGEAGRRDAGDGRGLGKDAPSRLAAGLPR
jgi:uncharacterized protein YdaU (DUF1376 family)